MALLRAYWEDRIMKSAAAVAIVLLLSGCTTITAYPQQVSVPDDIFAATQQAHPRVQALMGVSPPVEPVSRRTDLQ
jgi:uncharacterized lipoprotein